MDETSRLPVDRLSGLGQVQGLFFLSAVSGKFLGIFPYSKNIWGPIGARQLPSRKSEGKSRVRSSHLILPEGKSCLMLPTQVERRKDFLGRRHWAFTLLEFRMVQETQ